MQNKPQVRVVDIDGTLNFRDLGGYVGEGGKTVHWGKVYRSAQLDRLTPQGIAQLKALEIKVVVDLRFSDESQRYPTNREAVPEADMLSWHDDTQFELNGDDGLDREQAMKMSWRDSLESDDPGQVREAMRVNYPKKLYSHAAIYRSMILRLAQGATPLVFHCAAGKDRTGVAAALILSLLGVDNSQIISDYELTQKELENRFESWMTGGAGSASDVSTFQDSLGKYRREVLNPVFEADPAYIETLLDYVDATYGNFHMYATERLEISQAVLDQLKQRLLT